MVAAAPVNKGGVCGHGRGGRGGQDVRAMKPPNDILAVVVAASVDGGGVCGHGRGGRDRQGG